MKGFKMFNATRQCLIFAVGITALCLLPPGASGQQVTYRKTGKTTASPSDYSVSYGPTQKLPKNYDFYYYNRNYTPPAKATATRYVAAPRRVVGYVKPYSDLEYGKIVADLISSTNSVERSLVSAHKAVAGNQVAEADQTAQSSALDTAPTGARPVLQTAVVASVLDKGVLVTSGGVHIRLRGVQFPSITSHHAERRAMAERVLAALRDLTEGKIIYYVEEDPQFGHDGSVLAIVHLRDGTELNRLALESGMAILSPGDFLDESSADPLVDAETEARKAKRGFWAD
jgi:endonuclease YncB( thermonuclease family)